MRCLSPTEAADVDVEVIVKLEASCVTDRFEEGILTEVFNYNAFRFFLF